MKTKLNIALEGTCSGDVVGGLLSWTGEAFRRFCFAGRSNKKPLKKTNSKGSCEGCSIPHDFKL
jgi:hypothetical protein